jgi:UDP-glucuronate 4-epimerase
MQRVLITGAAGFIGFHTVRKLVADGCEVTGVDNINNYYNPELKFARLEECGINRLEIEEMKPVKSRSLPGYSFIKLELKDRQ